jgi:hypothetical protein
MSSELQALLLDDLPAFCAKVVGEFVEGVHEEAAA